MKNKDTILKYLSDMMLPGEKKAFEKKLSGDHELAEEFELLNNKLGRIKENANVKFDNRYFASNLVNIKDKAYARKRINTKVYSYAFSSAAAVIIMVVLFFQGEKQGDFFDSIEIGKELYSAITNTDSSELDYILKKDMFSNYSYYGDLTADLTIDFSNAELNGALETNYNLPYNYNYEILDDVSNEKIDELYNEILETKIL